MQCCIVVSSWSRLPPTTTPLHCPNSWVHYTLPVAAREQPNLILIAADLAGVCVVPLVRDLRAVSPRSRIVVVGKFLEPEAHNQLDDLDVASFIQWKTVTLETLWLAIAAVRDGKMQVVGKEASRATLQLIRLS